MTVHAIRERHPACPGMVEDAMLRCLAAGRAHGREFMSILDSVNLVELAWLRGEPGSVEADSRTLDVMYSAPYGTLMAVHNHLHGSWSFSADDILMLLANPSLGRVYAVCEDSRWYSLDNMHASAPLEAILSSGDTPPFISREFARAGYSSIAERYPASDGRFMDWDLATDSDPDAMRAANDDFVSRALAWLETEHGFRLDCREGRLVPPA